MSAKASRTQATAISRLLNFVLSALAASAFEQPGREAGTVGGCEDRPVTPAPQDFPDHEECQQRRRDRQDPYQPVETLSRGLRENLLAVFLDEGLQDQAVGISSSNALIPLL